MNDDIRDAVLHSIAAWAEQCDAAARSDDPVKNILHLAANLRMARENLDALYRRRDKARSPE